MALEPLTPERRRQQTRDYLIQAAAQVFAERGFHGASLDQVAAAAGFTKGAVYSNFKNKEELFLALLEANREREMDALYSTLEASDVPPEDRLPEFVNLVQNQTTEIGGNWDILYTEFALYAMRNPTAREKLAEFDARTITKIADLLIETRAKEGIESLEHPEQMARIIMALFRGISVMRALDADAVNESFLETAVAFVARGLLDGPLPPSP
jgi:AcrR family transcriptional regulator